MTEEKREIVIRSPFDGDVPGEAPKQFVSEFEQRVFEQVRARADRARQALGSTLTLPQMNQDPLSYRCQIVSELSQRTNLKGVSDFLVQQAKDIGDLEALIYDKALKTPAEQGRLAEIKSVDRSGRTVSEFVGAKTWMSQFKAVPQTGVFADENGKPLPTPVLL